MLQYDCLRARFVCQDGKLGEIETDYLGSIFGRKVEIMLDEKERLDFAKWVLERNLSWIAAAEVKVGVIVTIDMAMLGGLAAAFGTLKAGERTAAVCLGTLVPAVLIAIAIICAGISIYPKVGGPLYSLLFFGRIAQIDKEDYSAKFRQATEGELLNDLTAQIHRNAEIAASKFEWVKKSMFWSFISVLPWISAIAFLVKR